MSGPPSISLGILSTYPPTQCGLATFSAALCSELVGGLGDVGVVRVVDRPETHSGSEVIGHLVNGDAASALQVVGLLNQADVVIVQHEYGIFGGPDGSDIVPVLEALTVPLLVVLHTVLEEPTPGQRRVLTQVVAAADGLVTMTETARQRVIAIYGADPRRVHVIAHGAPRVPVAQPVRPRGTAPLILTWGLLGPGKGIEWAIDALAELRDLKPHYLVLGSTHPKVLAHDGERYREGLRRRAAARGVLDLVDLNDSYLSTPDLAGIVAGADVIVLPYDSREQVTSGVLVEAVAAGRPVVATGFPHAVELLSDGLGLVVPQRDPAALAAALRRVLTEPDLAGAMSARATAAAPGLLWDSIAADYRRLAGCLVADRVAAAS